MKSSFLCSLKCLLIQRKIYGKILSNHKKTNTWRISFFCCNMKAYSRVTYLAKTAVKCFGFLENYINSVRIMHLGIIQDKYLQNLSTSEQYTLIL